MQLPLYELDHSVYLREGDPVTIDGLYLPDLLDAGGAPDVSEGEYS
ncbi:hypothetical protein LNQ52_14930 [Klebsiella pneumoniae subsp. pneumoniae]|nr:hypothetical protein [Klebsiella pneumoniae subsp. pneumoniae]